MDKREPKFFAADERAQALFNEEIGERKLAWASLIESSNLGAADKENYKLILQAELNPAKHTSVDAFLDEVVTEFYKASHKSDQIPAAVAVYKAVETKIEEFRQQLHS
jgi:hypothetical protein